MRKIILGFSLAAVLIAVVPVRAAESTGLVYHPDYLLHDTGEGHPERPARLHAILYGLKKQGLLNQLVRITPREATDRWLREVHTAEYLQELKHAASKAPVRLDPDTVVSSESERVARLAVGGALAAVDAVMTQQVSTAFIAARPPGHHAFADRGEGFCLLNTVAVATRYVQKKYGIKKVLIVDWDVHHGNGTQDIFYSDPSVFYFSTHQWPYYPGTGADTEKGVDQGVNTTLNVPVPAGTGDQELVRIFEDILLPAAREFQPEFIFISAGFDAHQADPLADLGLSANGYRKLTRIVKQLARDTAHGRIVSVFEGGYDLEALADSVSAHIGELSSERSNQQSEK